MKIACALGQGFEDSEFRIPYDRLKEEGYQVDIIGLKAGEELKGYKGKEKVKAEKAIDQVKYEVKNSAACSSETKARLIREIMEYEGSHGTCTQTFIKKVRKQIRPLG